MKVGIIGRGFVGSATFEGLGKINNEMSFYDPKIKESKFEDVLETDIVYICVPTNPNDDGTCDTTIVEEVIQNLLNLNYSGVMAIKSTISPTTCEKIIFKLKERGVAESFYSNICHVPEFLRERSANLDFDNMDILIAGTDYENVSDVVFKSHGQIPKHKSRMSPTEAELAKYYNNVYNTLRIIFANGFYEVCKTIGASYQNIYDVMVKQDTISGHYLKCSETIRGADGYCLPKDSAAFMRFVESIEMQNKPEIFKTIVKDNEMYPKTVLPGSRTLKECIGKDIKIFS